jgi:Flp pilus assembly pilin Flp
MFKHLSAFARSDSGSVTVEYSLVVAIFGVTMIGALQVIFNTSGSQLTSTQSQLQSTALSLPSPAAAKT